ncbi:MAG: hypothetical protein AAF542_18870 [Pseudomonadota bacterium]
MPDIHHLYLGIPALLIVGGSFALWIRAFQRVAIPKDRTTYVVTWIVGGSIGLGALMMSESGDLTRIPAWFAVSTSVILLLLVSISRQVPAENTIRVSDCMPTFTAIDEHGEPFNSLSLQGHLALIKFFRAHW